MSGRVDVRIVWTLFERWRVWVSHYWGHVSVHTGLSSAALLSYVLHVCVCVSVAIFVRQEVFSLYNIVLIP